MKLKVKLLFCYEHRNYMKIEKNWKSVKKKGKAIFNKFKNTRFLI